MEVCIRQKNNLYEEKMMMKEKKVGVDHELLCNLLVMIAEEYCTIEEARTELDSNPEAFIEKVRKGI